MAIDKRQLRTTRDLNSKLNFQADHQRVALFGPTAAPITAPNTFVDVADDNGLVGDRLRPLTPMTMVRPANHLVPWVNGTTIDAFVLGKDGLSMHEDGAMQLSATNERHGVALFGGTIPADQIPLPVGQLIGNLEAALRDGMRAQNFQITNLDGVA